jgi:hypothetical protein
MKLTPNERVKDTGVDKMEVQNCIEKKKEKKETRIQTKYINKLINCKIQK